ncbi:hypothetical protein N8758_04445 [Crocinitomicaceae bacterium]|nr:hypothetical protein [Crocinitomicaceae bacterium]
MFHFQGARKKKGLTDLVKIIPFPDQNLRERHTKTATKSTPKPTKKSRPVKPAPKEMSAPTGRLNTTSISIKKLMNPKENGDLKAGVDMDNMPMNDYSFDDLKMVWRQFAFEMKDDKPTFYNALIKRDPIQKNNREYIMEVDNQVQIDYIFPLLSNLVDFVRKALKNYALDIKIELTKNPEEEVKFLTGKDKFTALARKNPNLHTLKNTFNLDIEF